MKKTHFLGLLLLISFFSCSKDDSSETLVGFQEELPFPTFYANAGFNTSIIPWFSQPPFEVGFTFKPLEYGVVKAITIKLPANFNRNRITLWDKATGTALLTWRIPILTTPAAGIEYVIPLETPFALTKNKEYILSINVENWYMRQRGGPDAPYPFTVGSIQILNYIESPTSPDQIMPTIVQGNYVVGDLGFKFQRI
jgi:hypothetical protein